MDKGDFFVINIDIYIYILEADLEEGEGHLPIFWQSLVFL